MKKRLNLLAILIICMAMFIIPTRGSVASASSKKAVYLSSLTKSKEDSSGLGVTNKVSIKGRKLKVVGSFSKSKTEDKFYDGDYKLIKYKKRTFKLTKNCKYYNRGGDAGTKKISKKSWLRLAKSYNGLALLVFTNKKGQVYKLMISS